MKTTLTDLTHNKITRLHTKIDKSNNKFPQLGQGVSGDKKILPSLSLNNSFARSTQNSPLLPKLAQKQNEKVDLIRKILQEKKVPIKLMPMSPAQKVSKFGWKAKTINSPFSQKAKQSLNFATSQILQRRKIQNYNLTATPQIYQSLTAKKENNDKFQEFYQKQIKSAALFKPNKGVFSRKPSQQIETCRQVVQIKEQDAIFPKIDFPIQELKENNVVKVQNISSEVQINFQSKMSSMSNLEQINLQKKNVSNTSTSFQGMDLENSIKGNVINKSSNSQNEIQQNDRVQNYTKQSAIIQENKQRQIKVDCDQFHQNLQQLKQQNGHENNLQNGIQNNQQDQRLKKPYQNRFQFGQKISFNFLSSVSNQKPLQLSNFNTSKCHKLSNLGLILSGISRQSFNTISQIQSYPILQSNQQNNQQSNEKQLQQFPTYNFPDDSAQKIVELTKSPWIKTAQQIKQLVKKIQFDKSLLSRQIFDHIMKKFQSYYLNKQQKLQLLHLLLLTYRVNFGQNSKQVNQLRFCGQIGINLYKLHTNVKIKTAQCLQYLKFLSNKPNKNDTDQLDILFPNLKFDLSQQQLRLVSKVIEKFCQKNMDAFAFMTAYLQTSIAKKLESKSFTDVQKDLNEVVLLLQNIFPATVLKQNKKKDKYYDEKENKQIEQEHKTNENNENNQNSKTKDNKDNKQEQKTNKQKSDHEKESERTLQDKLGIKSVAFCGQFEIFKFEKSQKSNLSQLKQFVIKKAKLAQQDSEFFNKLVKDNCLEYGYGYKYGLKIRNQNQQSPVFRTIQKILTKKFEQKFLQMKQRRLQNADQKYKQFNNDLLKYMKWQQQAVQQQVKNILQLQQSIKFTAKDLVRGKCKFNSIEDIGNTVNLLKTTIQKKQNKDKNISICQISNRLNDNTKDVVVFIKLQHCIAQLQLVLKQDTISNQINHKIYELKRSKIFASITNLFIQGRKWGQIFFGEQIQLFDEMLLIKPKQNFKFKNSFVQLTQSVKKFKQNYLQAFQIKYCKSAQEKQKELAQIQLKLKQMDAVRQKGYININQKDRKKQKKSNQLLFYHKNQAKQQTDKIIQNTSQSQMDENHTLYIIKGDIYKQRKQIKQSIEQYNKYIQYQNKKQKPKSDKQIDQIADVYFKLGQAYQNQQSVNNIVEAEKMFINCYQMKKKIVDKTQDKTLLISVLNKLGNLQRDKGNYVKAQKYYNDNIKIIQSTKGKDSLQAAQTYSSKGYTYQQKRKFQLAEQQYKKAEQIYIKTKGPFSVEVAKTYSSLGGVYRDIEQFNQAQKYYKKSLYINQLTKKSADVAMVFNNLGILQKRRRRFKEAQKYYIQCLKIRKQLSDNKETLDTAQIYMNLGNVYIMQDRFEETKQHLQKCLQIRIRLLGTQKHLDVAGVMNAIGVLYYHLHDKKAIEYYKKSQSIIADIKQKKDCLDLAKIYNNMGSYYDLIQGDYVKSLENYLMALNIQKQHLGKNHIQLGLTYYNISLQYLKMITRQSSISKVEEYLNQSQLNIKKAQQNWNYNYGQDNNFTKYVLELNNNILKLRKRNQKNKLNQIKQTAQNNQKKQIKQTKQSHSKQTKQLKPSQGRKKTQTHRKAFKIRQGASKVQQKKESSQKNETN